MMTYFTLSNFDKIRKLNSTLQLYLTKDVNSCSTDVLTKRETSELKSFPVKNESL